MRNNDKANKVEKVTKTGCGYHQLYLPGCGDDSPRPDDRTATNGHWTNFGAVARTPKRNNKETVQCLIIQAGFFGPGNTDKLQGDANLELWQKLAPGREVGKGDAQ